MLPDRSPVKVGALVLTAIVILAGASFFVGEQNQLFVRKSRYVIRFRTAAGLKTANSVQLSGVDVGRVERIVLPEQVGAKNLEVWIAIDRSYSSWIRTSSKARIKTLGLLGDKYVEITPGSPEAEEIPLGGEIPAASRTDVDQLISSGEDVVLNVVSISHSLDSILARMERGEGLLGELTVQPEGGKKLVESIQETLESVRTAADLVVEGEGPLGRLLDDGELADDVASAVDRLDSVLAAAEEGEGALPALLHDPTYRERLDAILTSLLHTSEQLEEVTTELREGKGTLPRLLNDEEYGDRLLGDLEALLDRLRQIADALATGDGTAARLIRDDELYTAVEDIIVGIDESRLLRWLVRNRQKAGTEKRYDEALAESGEDDGTDP